MRTILSTLPSHPSDPRSQLPRSTNCPGGCDVKDTPPDACLSCAWGLQTSPGVPIPAGVTLVPKTAYTSQCGVVSVVETPDGQLGAARGGRLFLGIEGNQAFETFRTAQAA